MSENEDDKKTNVDDDGSDYGDMLSEEVEPKLKYVRMSYDLHRILEKESVTCLAVHPKVS